MMPTAPLRCYIGWDASELRAWNIACASARSRASVELDIRPISMTHMQTLGFYRRPTGMLEKGYWDEISNAPMATGHAIARFLVPVLCNFEGWALFTDGDILVRQDLAGLFALADPTKAVQVVQHAHVPKDATKMEGQAQSVYPRKNWSSVILFNCAHPSNRALTVDLVNTVPGRDLHRFCWLQDDEIGALPPTWNWLEGYSAPVEDPALVHFTAGVPDMPGYEHCAFSDEWYQAAKGCGYKLTRPRRPVADPDSEASVLEQIERVQVATVQAGDVVVITMAQALSAKAAERLQVALARYWPNNKILIVDQGATVGVVRECSH